MNTAEDSLYANPNERSSSVANPINGNVTAITAPVPRHLTVVNRQSYPAPNLPCNAAGPWRTTLPRNPHRVPNPITPSPPPPPPPPTTCDTTRASFLSLAFHSLRRFSLFPSVSPVPVGRSNVSSTGQSSCTWPLEQCASRTPLLIVGH